MLILVIFMQMYKCSLSILFRSSLRLSSKINFYRTSDKNVLYKLSVSKDLVEEGSRDLVGSLSKISFFSCFFFFLPPNEAKRGKTWTTLFWPLNEALLVQIYNPPLHHKCSPLPCYYSFNSGWESSKFTYNHIFFLGHKTQFL